MRTGPGPHARAYPVWGARATAAGGVSRVATAVNVMDGQSELDAALAVLSAMSITSRPLAETSAQVTRLAARAVPGADGAGLTLPRRRGHAFMAASGDLLRALDQAQHRLGEGPCPLAVATRTTQVSGCLGDDPRWPRWGPTAAAFGARSALSSPLLVEGSVIGALIVYAHARDAFHEASVRAAEAFCAPAAVIVHIADVFENGHRTARHLQRFITGGVVINQAIGVLMGQHGWRPGEALDHLRATSRSTGTDIARTAGRVVDEATADTRRALPEDPPS